MQPDKFWLSYKSPWGSVLLKLEGAWPGLLLGGSIQLSLGIHHGQTLPGAGSRKGQCHRLWCWQQNMAPWLWLPLSNGLGVVGSLLLLLEGVVAPLQGEFFNSVRG